MKSPIFSRLRRANKNKVKRTIYTIDSGRRRRPKFFELNPPLVSPLSKTRGGFNSRIWVDHDLALDNVSSLGIQHFDIAKRCFLTGFWIKL